MKKRFQEWLRKDKRNQDLVFAIVLAGPILICLLIFMVYLWVAF